jgi:O-glycosyl hydrolase
MKQPCLPLSAAVALCLLTGLAGTASAQPEVMAWGNLTGIRVDGYLLELHSSLCVTEPDGVGLSRTGRERQNNSYSRNGKTETVKIWMRTPKEFRKQGSDWAVGATEVVEDTGTGSAKIDVEFWAPEDANIGGTHLCLDLPAALFSGGTVQLIEPVAPAPAQASLAAGEAEQNEYLRGRASGVRFVTLRRQIEVVFSQPTDVLVRDDRRRGSYDIQVLLTVSSGKLAAAQPVRKSFAVKVTGEVDKDPVELSIDASRAGQIFDGLGGNFRLQNARTDPPVIQYSLDNLRVAWGRVEMPWALWHPTEDMDPLAAARDGKANPRVLEAMDMARRLAQKGMPVMVSAWSAPSWAVLGALGGRNGPGPAAPRPAAGERSDFYFPPRQPEGPRGNPLNPEKMDRIQQSIAGYLVYLKEKYGVEAALFSFNESDLGINVRQTPREHAQLIRTLGAHFASRGLATRLALGDTSDADPIEFIQPAMRDPEAVRYIGAVDFHSWRGCTDEKLAQWHDAARELNVPLIVAEGSTDAAAWRYPRIFAEPSFALYEINLYTRILALAQPKSILQWQFTADYSVLSGGGIFNDSGPLHPTQRFWNLKQLASTPPRSFALPVKCNRPGITCAALGNIAEGIYTLHVVNNGGARPATVTGLPAGVKQLRIWVTDKQRGMQEGERIPVTGGKAQFTLGATSYTTLIGNQ